MVGLVTATVCRGFGRIFGVSFRPGARAGFLAKPNVVLASARFKSFAAGAAILTLLGSWLVRVRADAACSAWLGQLLVISLLVSLAMIFGELFMKHGAEDAVRAGEILLTGPLSKSFWIFVVGLGSRVPIILMLWPISSIMPNIAAPF